MIKKRLLPMIAITLPLFLTTNAFAYVYNGPQGHPHEHHKKGYRYKQKHHNSKCWRWSARRRRYVFICMHDKFWHGNYDTSYGYGYERH